ncbi:uncharacterized protein EAE98_010076 [Botrytis deweyae]|uniref:Uncharacterized protein n=1 Tax=Botrytis deweyae TaxID=2478750 RepID=A0ABQ7I9Q6_9HELO|nr:uncharacterized protein EAE98_010076 [Botrytis deweyae]KAF7917660.1 hypothetical protein EAE98_010076 [Botrytis deweyae]
MSYLRSDKRKVEPTEQTVPESPTFRPTFDFTTKQQFYKIRQQLDDERSCGFSTYTTSTGTLASQPVLSATGLQVNHPSVCLLSFHR